MGEFSHFVTPLNRCISEPLLTGGQIEYEDFPCTIDVTGPLLYTLFQERWQETQIGHVVEGGVLELEFTQPPKICILYDGYLTVVTEAISPSSLLSNVTLYAIYGLYCRCCDVS